MGVHSDLWLSVILLYLQSRPAVEAASRMAKYSIVMVRHGESEWNKLNKFCGWYNADLSQAGKDEATAGGAALKADGFQFDVAHTSLLTRANNTLEIVLDAIGQKDLEVKK